MTGRILLVETDVVLGAVLAEVLRHSGYEVIIVKTLANGEIGGIHSMSTVILDIDTTSAEEELAWLNTFQSHDGPLPIVLMGTQVPQALRDCRRFHFGRQQTSALPLVRKPFRNEELLAAIRQAQESNLLGQANRI
jgi:DNA-binding response OmpR family regulator